MWYEGAVWKVNDNGTYALAYDDGEYDGAADADSMRPQPAHERPTGYSVGDLVEIPHMQAWYDGSVVQVTTDDQGVVTYTVSFDAGQQSVTVPARRDTMRPRPWMGGSDGQGASAASKGTGWTYDSEKSCGAASRWPDMYNTCDVDESMTWANGCEWNIRGILGGAHNSWTAQE